MSSPQPIVTVEMTDVRIIEPDPAPAESAPAGPPRRKSRLPGLIAFAAVVVAAGIQVAAIVVASANDYPPAVVLAWFAIVLSAAAVVAGVVAAILGRGRRWGIAAAVLGIVTNPLVLLGVLRFVAG